MDDPTFTVQSTFVGQDSRHILTNSLSGTNFIEKVLSVLEQDVKVPHDKVELM